MRVISFSPSLLILDRFWYHSASVSSFSGYCVHGKCTRVCRPLLCIDVALCCVCPGIPVRVSALHMVHFVSADTWETHV